MAESTDLTLLTAAKAAAILGVDVKTLGRMQVPYVMAGQSKRYTQAILARHIERSERQCQANPAPQSDAPKGGRSRAKHISAAGPVRLTGKSASGSTIIDFEQVAGLKSGSKPPRLLNANGDGSGARSS